MGWTRRLFLQLALAGAGIPLLPKWVFGAISKGAVDLARAPKRALVIGNSRYVQTPLRNPVNDANGMAEALRGEGFSVELGLEMDRPGMQKAIGGYTQSLASSGSVGLFYFAGHGAQLAWRNYLLPVDAEIGDVYELRERAVDVNTLIEGIRRAGNPMNIIILDACRDNPFGSIHKLEQKGLSQLDAPPGTLLAYATAPGHTAIDGEGTHGLYTGNLLKEIRVPETRVEDVFKRVRLAVRRRSNGLQIPWESTSLEEDFYFVPPASLRTLAEESAALERKRVEAELAAQRAAEEAERQRKLEQAKREAEEAERKRREELALLEKKRQDEEAELARKQEAALKEAQRIAEEAERKRREEEALREAQRAKEEAERRYREEVALREAQRAKEEADRKQREEEARLAAQKAERERKEQEALEERRRAEAGAARRNEPAASAAQPDEALLEKMFEEELARWERIKEATDPAPLEDYLRRYPSGRFSELALLRLDQVLARLGEKKIEVVSSPDNPYSKGTVKANTAFRVGDTYNYRVLDLLTTLELRMPRRVVSALTETEIRFNNGRYVTDLLGNSLRFPGGGRWTPNQTVPLEFAVGKRWSTRFRAFPGDGSGENIGDTIVELDFRIADRETVTVPAGTFNAFRVEAQGWQSGMKRGNLANSNWSWKTWYDPDRVRMPVAHEVMNKNQKGRVGKAERHELVSFRQS
jgi:uncharacterized caspase-like protein